MPDATLTLIRRDLRLSARSIDALIMSLMLPTILMLMFVYLFGGAIQTPDGRYVTYVVPGVILLCAGYGSAQTAVSVCQDMRNGIVDRFRAMDIGGTAFLTGHVVASVARNLVSTVVVSGVALAIGFRPPAGPAAWLATIGVLLAFIGAISWLAATMGLLTRNPEAASGFAFVVMFLPYPSSAFVPIATMPSWLQPFARHQPVTPVIETMRGLLLNRPVGSNAWTGLAWCAGILVVAMVAAAVLFRRRTA
jgi:ABC-2 type transport system permease protein